jgi:hypothetical protein
MGKLAVVKTTQNNASVKDFINALENEEKRKDCNVLLKLMQKATGEKPKLWGSSIIGFGKVIIKSPTSGREVEWFQIGFSPRKANLTLYLSGKKTYEPILKKLGKYKTTGGCIYINKLTDIDMKVLEELINVSAKTAFFG